MGRGWPQTAWLSTIALAACASGRTSLRSPAPDPVLAALRCPSREIERTEAFLPRLGQLEGGIWQGCGRAVKCEYGGTYDFTLNCVAVMASPSRPEPDAVRIPHPLRTETRPAQHGFIITGGRSGDEVIDARRRERFAQFDARLAADPRDEAALSELVTIGEQVGEWATVRRAYRRYVEASDEPRQQVRLAFGRWLLTHGFEQAALDEARRVQSGPAAPVGVHSVLGQALARLNQNAEAKAELQFAIEEDAADSDAAEALRLLVVPDGR